MLMPKPTVIAIPSTHRDHGPMDSAMWSRSFTKQRTQVSWHLSITNTECGEKVSNPLVRITNPQIEAHLHPSLTPKSPLNRPLTPETSYRTVILTKNRPVRCAIPELITRTPKTTDRYQMAGQLLIL
ncbi:hypothetical protein ACFYTQ_31360 [Nocardia sp. NPDC004068]|uniref:hypothetical protein n=1 Tax=Nocardia sp. NPDC004068 TaxID=3364303 RepID=UPI0036A0CE9B